MSIKLEEHHLSRAAHSSELATDDPIHGFPNSIINKLVDLDDERIKNMDENNVAIQVLSHTPTNFLTAETIIACNDELAAAIRANKPRFSLALPLFKRVIPSQQRMSLKDVSISMGSSERW
ncbi:hypothetical protein FOYG_14855 [Fusarium oxysporum NRRL 32931]|uniref:Uncharacterized protein n=1 Tax=Fusarium oxysporum NRRL 32931 TaxID=660029 RepID=W9HKF0_FUSOX|nr:hypothetical protein FOYG_14855 [Fusarium oxysporum NRRL 32931]